MRGLSSGLLSIASCRVCRLTIVGLLRNPGILYMYWAVSFGIVTRTRISCILSSDIRVEVV